jgi:hypothetical protein
MKMVKSLVLGSAAALIAVGGAQAADLPVKAKAVEYVRVCSLYGAGFWYIPGTDTCIKIGGYLRVDTTFNGEPYDEPAWRGDEGQHNRYQDYFASRSRMALTVDTRTATEYGVVRTFGQLDWSSADPSGSFRETPTGAFGNQVNVEYLFLQFAGFTFGRSSSAYATPWNGYPGNNTSFLVGGEDTVTGTNNIQYTAQFGNGVSASIGLDDPSLFNRSQVINFATVTAGVGPLATLNAIGQPAGNAYAGVHAPDIVGNIRVDQAWGLFQISGALHEVNASYNILNQGAASNLSEISGHPEDKWGGSVMAALQIKNLPTGPGDDIKMDASWSKGDIRNTIGTSGGSIPAFAMFGNSGTAYQSLGFGVASDAVYLPTAFGGDGSLHLTEGFGFRGAFNHNWDPYWSTSLFGGITAVRYDGTAKANFCLAYAASNPGAVSADFSCNPNFNVSQIGVVTRWTPVKNLTFSVEGMWTHLDQSFTGSQVLTGTVLAPKPTAVYEFKDQDTASLNVRVQRNF